VRHLIVGEDWAGSNFDLTAQTQLELKIRAAVSIKREEYDSRPVKYDSDDAQH
jgi:hypothetical protein